MIPGVHHGSQGFETLAFDRAPQRVVSLVPSITESLFDLGLGAALVGATDYCTQPEAGVRGLVRIGGPKDPRTDEILALQPDLVIASREENPREAVQSLQAAGARVLVIFPTSVAQAMDALWALVGIFRSEAAMLRLETLQRTLDWMQYAVAERPRRRYFCPIWQEQGPNGTWWMTFGHETYAHDLLNLLGGENAFAGRQRRYPLEADLGLAEAEDPGERDVRYPRVPRAEVLAAAPELILLPSEPYPFGPAEREGLMRELAGTPAVEGGRVILVDGSLVTWYGTRLGKALEGLAALFD